MLLMQRKSDRPIQAHCDGKWAVTGANQTDWILYFKNSNGKWAVISTAGTKQTGMQRGCYNGLALRELGAPEEFMRQAPICMPAKIGEQFLGALEV